MLSKAVVQQQDSQKEFHMGQKSNYEAIKMIQSVDFVNLEA